MKSDKIDQSYLDESSDNNVFQCKEVVDEEYVSKLIDLDRALLELRPLKDGGTEEYISMVWVEDKSSSCSDKDHTLLELIESMNWIKVRFKKFQDVFSFFRIAYLEVLSDIKNKRNNLVIICNAEPVSSSVVHCGMWLNDEKMGDKLNRLKVYNAMVANSRIYMFQKVALLDNGKSYKFGVIEGDSFTLLEGSINSIKDTPVSL